MLHFIGSFVYAFITTTKTLYTVTQNQSRHLTFVMLGKHRLAGFLFGPIFELHDSF